MPVGAKMPKPPAALSSATAAGIRRMKGAWVEVAEMSASLGSQPAFLSFWCSMFRTQIGWFYFVLFGKGSVVAETNPGAGPRSADAWGS